MPKHATSLHIPRPCAQSWAAMTPAGPGRHCGACQKTVVDFTQQPDAEILAYFRQARQGGTCGRFRAGQLGRPLRPALAPRPARWQAWLAGVLVAALAAQGCQPTTLGEPAPLNTLASQKAAPDAAPVELARYPLPISGRVVDQRSQQPVGGVRVQLQGTSFVLITKADGLFAFPAAATPAPARHQRPSVLQLLAHDYPPCEWVLDDALPPPNQLLQVVPAALPVPTELMGDVDELRDKAD